MLDIKQIRYFGVLAETLHFGRAAARLNLSQPPLSRQIAALERELGVALFERSSRAVTLTRAGKSFQADAKAILASIEQSAKNALAAGRGERGELAIGFTSCATFNVMPALARSYAAAFPEVGLKIREMLADELVASVIDGKTDAAIAFPPEHQTGLEMRRLYRAALCRDWPQARAGGGGAYSRRRTCIGPVRNFVACRFAGPVRHHHRPLPLRRVRTPFFV
jgi:DNA-binding transcriptional LysR family regulator